MRDTKENSIDNIIMVCFFVVLAFGNPYFKTPDENNVIQFFIFIFGNIVLWTAIILRIIQFVKSMKQKKE